MTAEFNAEMEAGAGLAIFLQSNVKAENDDIIDVVLNLEWIFLHL